jgi:hypothetical protein
LSGEQFLTGGVGVFVVAELVVAELDLLVEVMLDFTELVELEVAFVDEGLLVKKVELEDEMVLEEVELEDKLQLAPEELKLAQVLDKSAVLLNASAMLLKFIPLETLNFAVNAWLRGIAWLTL